jgi:ferritin-like metal-binding protein YciE
MIQKAKNPELKQSLQQHLKVTEAQRTRLDQVQRLLTEGSDSAGGDDKGLLSRLFKRSQVCKGMQGIISEGEKIMAEDMSPEVMDAAIIACAQKVEHYEICGYGTARAFAQELELTQVADLLEQTLDEEYEADDRLTNLAVSRLNERAEKSSSKRSSTSRSAIGDTGRSGMAETTRQRTPREEMEMASGKRGSTAGGKTTTGKGATTTGGASRTAGATRSATESRSSTTARGAAGNVSGTKNTGKGITGRDNQSSANRGGTTGRSNTSGRS